jgi:DNA-binding MarR family transcriptional regulator
MAKTPSSLDAHLGFWLRFVSNHVSYAFKRKVEAHGVTVAEWIVLRQSLTIGACSPSRLAEELGMTRGAISKLVERLVGKKLVSRTSGQVDRRYQAIALTAAGRRLVPVLAALADRNDVEFFGHLAAEQWTGLADLLKDIVRRHGLKDVPIE